MVHTLIHNAMPAEVDRLKERLQEDGECNSESECWALAYAIYNQRKKESKRTQKQSKPNRTRPNN